MRPATALTVATLLLLTACARTGGPAPVEFRGVGYGETHPGIASTGSSLASAAPQPVTPGTYQPPAGYGAPAQSGIQAQALGEPQDAYSQTALSPNPSTIAPAAGPTPITSPTPPPAQTALSTVTPASAALPPAAPGVQGNGQFGWPLRGTILSGYGPKQGGQANDGLNIAAPLGTAVYAAKEGTVAYAGNELKSFGNMVLLRHEGGYFTVYAHLDQVLVSKEQTIIKGQPVGTVGQSGGVSAPQLHFEVRRGSTPQDPKKYLGS